MVKTAGSALKSDRWSTISFSSSWKTNKTQRQRGLETHLVTPLPGSHYPPPPPHDCPHRQLVVEALQPDHQAVLSSHQLVLQLSHVSFVGRLRQVMSQDVDEEVEEDQTDEKERDSSW